jgi:protein SCO1/2
VTPRTRPILPAVLTALFTLVLAACAASAATPSIIMLDPGASASNVAMGERETAYSPARPAPPLQLTDQDGRPFDVASLKGTPVFVYFGYTHCPDVCPLQMANIAAALRRLPPAVAREIRVVFVSTDSVRDSLPRMRHWLDQFDSSFVGLTASLARVNAVLAATRILAQAAPQPDGHGGYLMGHSGLVLAFARDDTARIAFPPSTTAEGWTRDLTRLVTIGPPPASLGPGPLPQTHPATN